MTVHKHSDGSIDLMVSQPGGTFVTLVGKKDTKDFDEECLEGGKDATLTRNSQLPPGHDGPSLIFHPLGSGRARNAGVTSEVIGNISRRKRGEQGRLNGMFHNNLFYVHIGQDF